MSHESLHILRVDDARLEGLPRSNRLYPLCDLSTEADVRHLVLHCPTAMQHEHDAMSDYIRKTPDGLGNIIFDGQHDLLFVLLGKFAI